MPYYKKLLLPIVMLGIMLAVACASSAPSSPAVSSSPSAPSQPAASTASSAKPAESKAASPQPSAATDWKAEWDKILAAAKKEGTVVVGGARGAGYTKAAAEFNKFYPDIKLEYTAMSGKDAAPKILAERQAGLYLWDVYLGGSTTMLNPLMPSGVFEPLQPNLILPEVLDDSKWRQGFDDGFQDAEGKYVYAFFGYLSYAFLMNYDVPGASGIKTLNDFLDPKWKGMVVWQDPRVAGSGSKQGGNFYFHKGADWYRRLLSNGAVALGDARMVLERLARGQAVAAVGSREDDENEFRKQGLLQNTGYFDDGTPAVAHVTGGSGDIAAVDRPPHPNAQIVFLNWLLSKQGQETYVKATEIHSRRLDVPAGRDQANIPKPGIKYEDMGKEKHLKILEEAVQVAAEALK